MTVRVFVSYSHRDDAHRIRFKTHMAALEREKDIAIWFDGDIEPGREITPEIRKQLRQTDIFPALGSSSYLHSDYCYRREYRPMLRKSKQGRPRVVVALVGICDWPSTEMARSKMLPDDARSVEEHGRPNRAHLQIVQGLHRVVRSVRQEKGKEHAEAERQAADKAKATSARQTAAASAARTKAPKASRSKKPSTKSPEPKTKAASITRKAKSVGSATKRTTRKTRPTAGAAKPGRSKP